MGLIVIFSILAILTKLIGAAISLKLKLLSQGIFAIIVVVVLMTTIVTPLMMKLFFKSNSHRGTNVD